MAPLGPAPEMVSKLISFSACVSRAWSRAAWRRAISSMPPVWRLAVEPGQEAHHRRAVALVRGARALDLGGVLARLGQDAGIAGAHHARLAALELAMEPDRLRRGSGGRSCRPSSAPSGAAPAPPGCAELGERAPGAPWPRGPILAGSMNSSGLPLAGTIANASTTGLWATSEPRMLNSQQIESGKVRTTASWPSFFERGLQLGKLLLGGLARVLAAGCGTTAPCGGGGTLPCPRRDRSGCWPAPSA